MESRHRWRRIDLNSLEEQIKKLEFDTEKRYEREIKDDNTVKELRGLYIESNNISAHFSSLDGQLSINIDNLNQRDINLIRLFRKNYRHTIPRFTAVCYGISGGLILLYASTYLV
jgi:hypothetical protein